MKLKGNFRGKAREKVLMVEMAPHEALLTIESLARQLQSGDPNTGRYEHIAEDYTDFSICVVDRREKP